MRGLGGFRCKSPLEGTCFSPILRFVPEADFASERGDAREIVLGSVLALKIECGDCPFFGVVFRGFLAGSGLSSILGSAFKGVFKVLADAATVLAFGVADVSFCRIGLVGGVEFGIEKRGFLYLFAFLCFVSFRTSI